MPVAISTLEDGFAPNNYEARSDDAFTRAKKHGQGIVLARAGSPKAAASYGLETSFFSVLVTEPSGFSVTFFSFTTVPPLLLVSTVFFSSIVRSHPENRNAPQRDREQQ